MVMSRCCRADGKGSLVSTGVVRRACYREVGQQIRRNGQLAVPVASI
jgi:hypothetical protein